MRSFALALVLLLSACVQVAEEHRLISVQTVDSDQPEILAGSPLRNSRVPMLKVTFSSAINLRSFFVEHPYHQVAFAKFCESKRNTLFLSSGNVFWEGRPLMNREGQATAPESLKPPFIYNVFLHVRQPEYAKAPNPFDLSREPADVCIVFSGDKSYGLVHYTTKELRIPKSVIVAALRERRSSRP